MRAEVNDVFGLAELDVVLVAGTADVEDTVAGCGLATPLCVAAVFGVGALGREKFGAGVGVLLVLVGEAGVLKYWD